MAIKKSQLYSLLWESCNVLRGSMDASQYKDYVLVILFIKYISDKAKDPSSMINVPAGCSFSDMVNLKNKPGIGDALNTIIRKLADANDLQGVITNADFDDDQKLGKDKDKVETISRLIAVFENKDLDFSNNRAADDDLIGDAYEYLMRNFASQSGKSKGQFYTPAEVSRVMAKVIGIANDDRPQITIYDPTCGSGSLLLRARAEARGEVSLEGQEKDNATIGMARMSMIIHGIPDAELIQGDTLNDPQHKINDTQLMQFDYVVANPPFSLKSWMKSAQENDPFGRWGTLTGMPPVPPDGCGDYAFLLHIIRSLKSNGKAACILPHGVLFRGNTEADIRRHLIERHLISGIIGLPSNIFFGTGIPACLIIIDKAQAGASKGIYMIDAKDGFEKDGAKNRLREQDIRRIVDTWDAHEDIPHYARLVSYEEIERNDFNLNIPRYIAPMDKEIVQDIYAHLHGGLPKYDVEEVLAHLWEACPSLKDKLFRPVDANYYQLAVAEQDVTPTITQDATFLQQQALFGQSVQAFLDKHKDAMLALHNGCQPKELIAEWGSDLLAQLSQGENLVNIYDVYQILMSYWTEAMQDDCYIISRDGWKIDIHPMLTQKVNKKAKTVTFEPKKNPTYADYECDLLPVSVVVDKFFAADEERLQEAQSRLEEISNSLEELEPEDGNDETPEYKAAKKAEKAAKDEIKALLKQLTNAVLAKYDALTEDEIRHLVVEDKWLRTLQTRMADEMQRVSQAMTTQVLDLQHRYKNTLPQIEQSVSEAEKAVKDYLSLMGLQ
ncbi:MAG: N-6 DNA methylase [Paludibacteraceae bacterium]|nr:N-6 DNA methylase [Paludibacteraceae bacterium]